MDLLHCKEKIRIELGQVDTPINIAQSLINLLPDEYDFFADLGAGLGNLSLSLTGVDGLLVEMDCDRFNFLKRRLDNNKKAICTDFLDNLFCLDEYISSEAKVLYLSNPPFNRRKLDYTFQFFEDLNVSSNFHQLDIAFLDKVISSMNSKSSVMFIMSAPFLTFERYASQREKLISSFDSLEVISLDDYIYKNTEVKSYAVIAHKFPNRALKKEIRLERMHSSGKIIDEVCISKKEGIRSLCFDYHQKLSLVQEYVGNNYKRLGDLNVSLIRGSRSKQEFEQLLLNPIHTTDLKEPFLFLNTEEIRNTGTTKFKTATVDDILITRVGKRSLDRESLVKEGSEIFTDSVYKLSSSSKDDSKIIWDSVSSEVGKLWRSMHAQGKCAKYLTRDAILNMPIC